ncbi:MAG TPA: ABC transporter permease [Firmicutes bacterium]|jgi:putative spermidine/putrescine transport system permease protein|nr:ABC transporter permease [Bacillota bacterium]
MKNRQNFHWILLGPTLLFLGFSLVMPLLMLIILSFHKVDPLMNILPDYSVSQYLQILSSGMFVKTIFTTLMVALITTVFCIVLAYPAAYLLVYAPNRWIRALFYTLLVSPLLTSVVVRTFAWIVLLAQNGLINEILKEMKIITKPLSLLWNMKAVIIAYIQVMLPFAVLPIVNSISEINPSLKKASMSLGAGKIRTFIRVTLPLTIPGMISGTVIVFSLAAGSYITPMLVGGSLQPLLPLIIYQQALQIMNFPMAGALSILLLLAVLIVILILEIILNRWEARFHAS